MRNRKQGVVLNGQISSLADVIAWIPQGSTLSLLLFRIYRNDLADDFSNAKLFADETPLLSVVHDFNISADEINNDLMKIKKWAYHWKMSFNSDSIKQAHEKILTRKISKEDHPTLAFWTITV